MDEEEVQLAIMGALPQMLSSIQELRTSTEELKGVLLPLVISRVDELLRAHGRHLEDETPESTILGNNLSMNSTILLDQKVTRFVTMDPRAEFLYRAVTLPSNGSGSRGIQFAPALTYGKNKLMRLRSLYTLPLAQLKTKLHGHLRRWHGVNEESMFLSCTPDLQRALFLTAQKGRESLRSGLLIIKTEAFQNTYCPTVFNAKRLLKVLDTLQPEPHLQPEEKYMALNCDENMIFGNIPSKAIIRIVPWSSLYGISPSLITFEFAKAFDSKLFAKTIRKLHVTKAEFEKMVKTFANVLGGEEEYLRDAFFRIITTKVDVAQWGYWIKDEQHGGNSSTATGIKRERESGDESSGLADGSWP